MIPVQSYTFQVPAGGSFPLQCTGRYFRINAASGTLKVTGDTFNVMGAVAPGQGLKVRAIDPPFQRLTFTDTSGAANNVTVIVADADFVDNTVLGSVSVIDGGKARTMAGQSFCATTAMNAGGAGIYCTHYLYNPPGNTKNGVVNSILVGSNSVQTVYLCVGAGAPTNPPVGAGGGASSKDAGAAAVSTLGSYQVSNVLQPTGTILAAIATPAGQMVPLPLSEPVIVRPGRWIALTGSASNVGMQTLLQFWEELIP